MIGQQAQDALTAVKKGINKQPMGCDEQLTSTSKMTYKPSKLG